MTQNKFQLNEVLSIIMIIIIIIIIVVIIIIPPTVKTVERESGKQTYCNFTKPSQTRRHVKTLRIM